MSVQTVFGKVDKDDLGIVSPHEHIFIDMKVFFSHPEEIGAKNYAYEKVSIEKLGVLKRNPFAMVDNVQMMDEQTQFEELMYFKYAGGRTVVDATNVGLGRDPELLQRMAGKTGLNIVVGSGYYVNHSVPKYALDKTVEEIEEEIVNDVLDGIGHTGIKAGIIGEIGVSHIMYPFEERSVTASCRAQERTGRPLSIHINPWSTKGIEAMAIVERHKLDYTKVAICHSDIENNEDYIFRILDKGVFMELDNFGKEMPTDYWDCKPGSGRFCSDWDRVHLMKKMIDRGYVDQMLISCDVCFKQSLHSYGGWGYDHVLKHIVPMLKEIGVTQEQVDQMLIYNPAKFLDVKDD